MIRDQLFLFPDLDPFKTIMKNIDYIDVSEIPEFKNVIETKPERKLCHVTKGKFFLFRTGGSNRFIPEAGKVFPYVQNMDTKYIYSPTLVKTYLYVVIRDGDNSFHVNMSRQSAAAFIVHPNPDKPLIADHKNKDRRDYRLENLRWATSSENNTNVDRSGTGFFEDRITRYTHTHKK